MTWIKHPDLPGQRVEVPDGAVPHYRASGWVVTEAPQKPKKLPADDGETGAPNDALAATGESAADETESKTETESPKPRRRTTKED